MPLPINPNLASLPVYQPGRPIEEVARELNLPVDQVTKLASNENPLGPSPKAIQAMQKAVPNLHLYPDGNSFYLKQRLAEKLKLSPENLIFGDGSNEIIEFIGHALMEPDTEIVVSEYCFAIYPIVAKMFGAEVVTVPAKNYGHNLPAMLEAITPKTRVIFVANPNNPTGTLVSNEAVMELVNNVPDHVLLVMDEAYFEFLDQPIDLTALIRSGEKNNLLIMRTFSKIYGLAGLRIGYGIAVPELISSLEKIRQPFNINAIAQAGALAALDDEEHLDNTRANNQIGLHFFENLLNELNLEFVPSSANFILARVGNGQHVVQELQKQAIIVRPMGGYQLPEWIRISIGTEVENQKCAQALKSILNKSAA